MTGSFTPRAVKTHNAARRNMIAGRRCVSLLGPQIPSFYTSARTGKRFNRLARRNHSGAAALTLHLIDSPDFHGLSPPPALGLFSFAIGGEPALDCRMKRGASRSKRAARLYFGGRNSLRSQPFARSDLRGSIRSHLAHSTLPGRLSGTGEPQCAQRESGIACPMARNLRLESEYVHSKYNPCGRKFDSARSGAARKLSPEQRRRGARVTCDVQRINAASCSATRRWPSAVM